jgi:hypothetical protein
MDRSIAAIHQNPTPHRSCEMTNGVLGLLDDKLQTQTRDTSNAHPSTVDTSPDTSASRAQSYGSGRPRKRPATSGRAQGRQATRRSQSLLRRIRYPCVPRDGGQQRLIVKGSPPAGATAAARVGLRCSGEQARPGHDPRHCQGLDSCMLPSCRLKLPSQIRLQQPSKFLHRPSRKAIR